MGLRRLLSLWPCPWRGDHEAVPGLGCLPLVPRELYQWLSQIGPVLRPLAVLTKPSLCQCLAGKVRPEEDGILGV